MNTDNMNENIENLNNHENIGKREIKIFIKFILYFF